MRWNYGRSVTSLQEPLFDSLWISLDLHGILAIVWTPAYSVVSICVCWPPKRRVYNITSSSLLHRKYLLLLCCLLKVSQYRLALIDTASVHIVKGISLHIHNTGYHWLLFGRYICHNWLNITTRDNADSLLKKQQWGTYPCTHLLIAVYLYNSVGLARWTGTIWVYNITGLARRTGTIAMFGTQSTTHQFRKTLSHRKQYDLSRTAAVLAYTLPYTKS